MHKNSRMLAALGFTMALAGCIAPPKPTVVTTKMPFDASQTLAALAKGSNAIKGSALLRQQGGGVITCAGLEVRLHPVTHYSSERISALYGSFDGGYRSVHAGAVVFEPDNNSIYQSAVRRTQCDAQGYFRIDDLLDGDFYLLTSITWRVGDSIQGGAIVRKIALRGGETKEIVLSAN